MLHFSETTNPDYVPKVEFTDRVSRSLFDLRLHLGSTEAPAAEALTPEEPSENLLCQCYGS